MRASSARQLRHVGLIGLGALGLAVAAFCCVWQAQFSVSQFSVPMWLIVSLIIFAAAVVSSTVGFAFSAIAGAMILHYVPNGVEAVQIMMIASIGIQAYSVVGLRASISWRQCAPFIFGGLAALPIGITLLLNLQPRMYIAAMGVGLIAYGAYMLLRRPFLMQRGGIMADALAGALGGITGPLAAFPGAFATIWCGARGWSKVEQRAVFQPYILVLQIAGVLALHVVSDRSAVAASQLGYALPGLAGAVIGLRIFHAMTDRHYQRLVNLALVVSGISLLLK